MGDEWVEVYDLAHDREYLERLQLATLDSGGFTLVSDHGLPGSSQWWTAIRDGSIPTHGVEGAISDIRVAGNWPEFEIDDLHQAIRDFAGRERRYGGLVPDVPRS